VGTGAHIRQGRHSAVGLSLVRVLTCYLLDILSFESLSLLTNFSQNIKNVRHRTVETGI
jgi:hypothetical protein